MSIEWVRMNEDKAIERTKDNNNSQQLKRQQELLGGAVGIFGEQARRHDSLIREVTKKVCKELNLEFPHL